MIDVDEDVQEFLEHFGVLGMHWGVRNDKERRAARERKAKKFEVKAKGYQSELEKLKTSNKPGIQFIRLDLEEKKKQAIADAERKRQGKLSSRQKKIVIGTSVAAAVITAYGAYNMAQSGEWRRLAALGKSFVTRKPLQTWKKKEELSGNMDANTILKHIVKPANPGFDQGAIGTRMNCRRATFAYEMRRRGYDVAATRTTKGRGQNAAGVYNAVNPEQDIARSGLSSILTRFGRDDAKQRKTGERTSYWEGIQRQGIVGENQIIPSSEGSLSENLYKSLKQQPNGARGEVSLQFGMGGHSVAWEIVHGKPVIFDAQTGKKYSNAESFSEIGNLANHLGYTRLDDRQLNEEFLLRWLKNAD